MTLIYKSVVRVVTRKWHASARCEERKGELFFSSAKYGFVAHSRVRLHSKWRWCHTMTFLKACLPGGEGPQVGEVTRLGGVKK